MAMTIPQAIKELKHQKAALDRHIAKGATYCDDYTEALGMAIKALEREIPRALQDDRCPICNARNDGDNWCFACGQALSHSLQNVCQQNAQLVMKTKG